VAPSPPARSQLWAAALQLWRGRPLLGIGPDVFRHVYGPLLGLSSWDDRIHTNNLYLEVLVGAGILGFAAFLALIGAALLSGMRALASATVTPQAWWAALGCGVALAAFLIHGLLDMFLEYTATYLLFWSLIGAIHAKMNDEQS
jgi:O-antigen ligase